VVFGQESAGKVVSRPRSQDTLGCSVFWYRISGNRTQITKGTIMKIGGDQCE